jgi:hypothetical protein
MQAWEQKLGEGYCRQLQAEHLTLVALGVDETKVLLRTKKDHAITQQQTSPDWRHVIGVKALFNQRWLESHFRQNQQINSVASASKPSCCEWLARLILTFLAFASGDLASGPIATSVRP